MPSLMGVGNAGWGPMALAGVAENTAHTHYVLHIRTRTKSLGDSATTARYSKRDVPRFLTAAYVTPARALVSSPTHGFLTYSQLRDGSSRSLRPAFTPAPPMHATIPLAMAEVAGVAAGTHLPALVGDVPDVYRALPDAAAIWAATPLEAHGERAVAYWRIPPGTHLVRGRPDPSPAAPALPAHPPWKRYKAGHHGDGDVYLAE